MKSRDPWGLLWIFHLLDCGQVFHSLWLSQGGGSVNFSSRKLGCFAAWVLHHAWVLREDGSGILSRLDQPCVGLPFGRRPAARMPAASAEWALRTGRQRDLHHRLKFERRARSWLRLNPLLGPKIPTWVWASISASWDGAVESTSWFGSSMQIRGTSGGQPALAAWERLPACYYRTSGFKEIWGQRLMGTSKDGQGDSTFRLQTALKNFVDLFKRYSTGINHLNNWNLEFHFHMLPSPSCRGQDLHHASNLCQLQIGSFLVRYDFSTVMMTWWGSSEAVTLWFCDCNKGTDLSRFINKRQLHPHKISRPIEECYFCCIMESVYWLLFSVIYLCAKNVIFFGIRSNPFRLQDSVNYLLVGT